MSPCPFPAGCAWRSGRGRRGSRRPGLPVLAAASTHAAMIPEGVDAARARRRAAGDLPRRQASGWNPVMGGLVQPEGKGGQAASDTASTASLPVAYATVHGALSRRGGLFKGKLVCRTEFGQERLINDYADTSFKAINDELCDRRHRSEAIASLINEMSHRLEEARDQKETQDLQRMDSPFVILYKRERLIGDRPEIAVYVQSVGFNSMNGAQQGYEGDMLPLGPAEDGDEIIVKRGVVRITAPIFLTCSLTFSREKNYAGGGGGGWSGGGGGGYGLGGGGGGGTFVVPSAKNVEVKVGTQYKQGREVLVGNDGDGSVYIREPIMDEEWHFECIEGAEEWLPPRSCIYIIKAMGGAGASAGTFKGGTGAAVEGMFQLEENERLILVCGKMGESFTDRWGSCGGGGGATCVFTNKISEGNALIVAGGGGGAAAPFSSKGGDGGHASLTTDGKNGAGAFHGEGGKDGHAGSTRHVRTCFIDSERGGSERFMSEEKVKAVSRQHRGFFPGAGSGIREFALGAAIGVSQGGAPKGPGGVAAGGFGGGGCGDWHPEETRIEGDCIDTIFHCRSGSPIIRDQVLTLTGHVMGAEFQPQCILVDGGVMLAECIDMTCSEGNACVAKSHKKSRHDDSPPGVLRMSDCTVNNCGGNGLLVIEGGSLEATKCRLTACRKDGIDVKGKGSSAEVSKVEILKTGARHVIVSKGATVSVTDATMDNGHSSGCHVFGQGSSLKLMRCNVNETKKNGVLVHDGAHCELRKCNIIASHDVGVLAVGVEDKIMDEETNVRLVHCLIKKNGYGVWAQDGAALKILGGAVTGSLNEDITQHTQPNMKTANSLISLGAQTRLFFVSWKKEAQISKALHQRLKGLSNDELDAMIKEIFNQFDDDSSGQISSSELGEALEMMGIKLNESDIQNILQEMDEDNDGQLSVDEFTLFCYRLVQRKRIDAEQKKMMPPPPHLLTRQDNMRFLNDPERANRFRSPDSGCAIVIRALLPDLQKLFAVSTPAHAVDQDDRPESSSRAPLAFSSTRNVADAVHLSEHFESQLLEIVSACQDGHFIVTKGFAGSGALMQALDQVKANDVVLLGPGTHFIPEGAQLDQPVGICSFDEEGCMQECEIVCKKGFGFDILGQAGSSTVFFGVKLTKHVGAQSASIVNRSGSVVLQNCTFVTSEGCAIFCAVESADCQVVCAGCKFLNAGEGDLALLAKDGATVEMSRCNFSGCSLHATTGGLIHAEACQFVESTQDSMIVDTDGVLRARNCKVIGSLQNGITVRERGMLTLNRCAVVRSRKIGIVCSGLASSVHLKESIVREGWLHGVSFRCMCLCGIPCLCAYSCSCYSS